MARVIANKGIVIQGNVLHWQPVLLNIMRIAGFTADTLPTFRRRGESTLWLFSRQSRPYGIIYRLGGCPTGYCFLTRLRGKHIISHWLGTDVMRYHGKLNPIKKLGIRVRRHLVDLELADSESVQEELRAVGIETKLLRLLPQTIVAEVTALPEQATVLSYWSDERFDFYGGSIFLALAKAFPEVKFLVALASGEGLTGIPANVEFLGLVDEMSEIYQKCTCLIRIPRHDGLSAMVLL